MTDVAKQTLAEEAVAHARLAERAGAFTWAHLEAEFTQDVDKIVDTLASTDDLAWTLPVMVAEDGSTTFFMDPNGPERYRYFVADSRQGIREQYEALRGALEILGWEAITEIRQSWYVVAHGCGSGRVVGAEEAQRGETVTLFPVGEDGILGELQINAVGLRRENRWPDVPTVDDPMPIPLKRLETLHNHDAYLDAVRGGDVDQIVAAHRLDAAAAFRSYLTPRASLAVAEGNVAIGEYFAELHRRYRVRDIQIVNRLAESWFVFAELHWTVEEIEGDQRVLEFCTAEVTPVDPDGKYWVRTGGGTDPVPVDG